MVPFVSSSKPVVGVVDVEVAVIRTTVVVIHTTDVVIEGGYHSHRGRLGDDETRKGLTTVRIQFLDSAFGILSRYVSLSIDLGHRTP